MDVLKTTEHPSHLDVRGEVARDQHVLRDQRQLQDPPADPSRRRRIQWPKSTMASSKLRLLQLILNSDRFRRFNSGRCLGEREYTGRLSNLEVLLERGLDNRDLGSAGADCQGGSIQSLYSDSLRKLCIGNP